MCRSGLTECYLNAPLLYSSYLEVAYLIRNLSKLVSLHMKSPEILTAFKLWRKSLQAVAIQKESLQCPCMESIFP